MSATSPEPPRGGVPLTSDLGETVVQDHAEPFVHAVVKALGLMRRQGQA